MRLLPKAMALTVATVLLLGGQELTARAAVPAEVETVTIKAATQTSLTLTWPRVPGADDYVVERGTDLDMSSRRVVLSTPKRRIRISSLQQGGLYCFQVRAVAGDRPGPRSRKVCQRTIAAEGTDSGPTYRVVTYNICGSVCASWPTRRPRAAALVAAQRPDVVMLQEASPESGMAAAIGGMAQVQATSGKALLYRRDRFVVATHEGLRRTGRIELGARGDKARYAVWAELVDRASRQHVIFVGTHLAPGNNQEAAAQRERETKDLVAGVDRINPRGLPLVVAGDLNSHQGRSPDTPTAVLTDAGLANSYFRAHRWRRGKINSANGFHLEPRTGSAWGYHLDQVWAEPGRTQVLRWANAAKLVDGQYAAPLPSNHNPILVKLRINE